MHICWCVWYSLYYCGVCSCVYGMPQRGWTLTPTHPRLLCPILGWPVAHHPAAPITPFPKHAHTDPPRSYKAHLVLSGGSISKDQMFPEFRCRNTFQGYDLFQGGTSSKLQTVAELFVEAGTGKIPGGFCNARVFGLAKDNKYVDDY